MEAVFLKLLNMSITAGWLVLAVILLRLVLKKAPKAMICILWGIVGLRLIFPVTIESVLSLVPSAETLPQDITHSAAPMINSGFSALNSLVNPVISEKLAPNAEISAKLPSAVSPMQMIAYIAAWVWLAGIAAMLIYTAVSYLRIRRAVREAIPADEKVYLCDRISTPFILGIIAPRIYLPSDISAEDAEFVIAHEKAHLCRLDHLWKPIGFLLLSVHWFNPLMWVAYILLCRDIETACDEKVIKELGSEVKKPYSSALLNCSVPRKAIAACPLAFGEVGVKSRIRSVLNYKKPAFWIIIIAAIACIATAVCFLTNPKEEPKHTEIDDDYYVGNVVYYDLASSYAEILPVSVPRYRISDDLVLYSLNSGEPVRLGILTEVEPTSENVSCLYNKFWQSCYEDRTFNVTIGPEQIRKDLKAAYKVTLDSFQAYKETHILLLNNGDVYLVKGHNWRINKLERGRPDNPSNIGSLEGDKEICPTIEGMVISIDEDRFLLVVTKGNNDVYETEMLWVNRKDEKGNLLADSITEGEIVTVAYRDETVDQEISKVAGIFSTNIYSSSRYFSPPKMKRVGHFGSVNMWEGADNIESIGISSRWYQPVHLIESRDELELFVSQKAPESSPNVLNWLLEDYGEEYFKNKVLMLSYIYASSGGNRYDLGYATVSGDTLTLWIYRTQKGATLDLSGWIASLELSRASILGISHFQAEQKTLDAPFPLAVSKIEGIVTNITDDYFSISGTPIFESFLVPRNLVSGERVSNVKLGDKICAEHNSNLSVYISDGTYTISAISKITVTE